MTAPRPKSPPLRIVFASEPSPRATVLADVLGGHGHEVRSVGTLREALESPEPDVWVLDRTLAGGGCGLDVLEELRAADRAAPAVMIDEHPDFEDVRRALELDAADFVLRPFEPGTLARAIARAHAERPRPPGVEGSSYQRSFPASAGSVAHAARELSAFLTKRNVPMAHRVRIASALADAVDNACRHAYPEGRGEVKVEVDFAREHVRLLVADEGRGFDAEAARPERVPAPLPRGATQRAPASTGLARIATLSESHAIASGPRGTSVELHFELTPVRFADEPEDFSATEFLDPSRARTLLAALREGASSLANVAPSRALTIGRLLGGDARRPPGAAPHGRRSGSSGDHGRSGSRR